MPHPDDSTLHIDDRNVFMQHAYNGVFSGEARAWPPQLKARVIAEIAQDLCMLVRSMPKEFQIDFDDDVTSQVRVS
jgi:hypothetical protein